MYYLTGLLGGDIFKVIVFIRRRGAGDNMREAYLYWLFFFSLRGSFWEIRKLSNTSLYSIIVRSKEILFVCETVSRRRSGWTKPSRYFYLD
jgi:hypothetical protein